MSVVQRVGGALVAAADAGIAHGRVTPASVLFDDQGAAYLARLRPRASAPATTHRDVADLLALVARHAVLPGTELPGRGVDDGRAGRRAARVSFTGRPADSGPPPNPYKGLRAFDETDAADFFGRAGVVGDIVERLGDGGLRGRFVLVVGGSGTGKSSVVRAGLLPAVRRGAVAGSEDWFVTTMVPGVVAIQGAGRGAAAGGGRRPGRHRRGAGRRCGRCRPDRSQGRARRRAAAPRHRPARGAVHLGARPPTSRRSSTGSCMRCPCPTAGCVSWAPCGPTSTTGRSASSGSVRRQQRHGDDPGDVGGRARGSHHRAGRAGRPHRRTLARGRARSAPSPASPPRFLPSSSPSSSSPTGPTTPSRSSAYRLLGGIDGAIAARAEQLFRSLGADQQLAVQRLFERLVVVNPDGEPTRRR